MKLSHETLLPHGRRCAPPSPRALDRPGPPCVGLRHPSVQPYAAYPTASGEDGAPQPDVLIAVQNDREFLALCREILGDASLASDPRFATNIARCENSSALDEAISAAFRAIRPRSEL